MATRDLQTFLDFGEIGYLYQYLWMDENNSVTFNNGLADLTLRMRDSKFVMYMNNNYPELGENSYMDMLYPENLVGIIDYLKNQECEGYRSKWEEIIAEVSSSTILALRKRERLK